MVTSIENNENNTLMPLKKKRGVRLAEGGGCREGALAIIMSLSDTETKTKSIYWSRINCDSYSDYILLLLWVFPLYPYYRSWFMNAAAVRAQTI